MKNVVISQRPLIMSTYTISSNLLMGKSLADRLSHEPNPNTRVLGVPAKRTIPPRSAPKGWFSEHDLMDLVEEDFPFEECKIPPGKMLLMREARSLYLVESGGNHYFWNELTDEFYVIVQPVKPPQILKLLEEGKMPVYRHLQQVWDN